VDLIARFLSCSSDISQRSVQKRNLALHMQRFPSWRSSARENIWP